MKILFFLLIFLFWNSAQSQIPLQNFFPKEIIKIDLSARREAEINRQAELLKKSRLTQPEKAELDALLDKHGEVVQSIWDITSQECSWYCGGGNYDVKASSQLRSPKGVIYKAEYANDLSYKTAWVEGKEGDGVGEFLEYYFKNKSPRVTKIIISNGYMKSEVTWKENNRVKRLKLYANGKTVGILNLKDSRTDQIFDVDTLGHNKNGSDLLLKFEIVEVYKGGEANDTAITEIYFDGIDVH